jgi:DNA-binding CsgD family transcriptional regulator
VLVARSGELESSFTHGVSLQLFEAAVQGIPPSEYDGLFAGAAGACRALVDPTSKHAAGVASGAGEFDLLHGMYWLACNLSRRRPLLLVVDDVQWADEPSLTFLAYLIPRIDRLPITVAVSLRTDEHTDSSRIITQLSTNRVTRRFALDPLTEIGVAALTRNHFFPGALETFCSEVWRCSQGNPFLATELLRTADAEGLDGCDEASTGKLAAIVPESVRHSALARLSRLPRSARRLAQSLSVLAEDTNLKQASDLAGLRPRRAVGALDQLEAAGIATYRDRIAFNHPLIRSAIYAELPQLDRQLAHEKAARLLVRDGASPEKVAAHLLVCEPAGEEWVVSKLWEAAGRARSAGSPASAVRYLRRALGEPPASDVRAELLLELGTAEAALGDAAAVDHLEAAVAAACGRSLRAEALYELGRVHRTGGALVEAAHAFERGLDLGHDLGGALRIRLAGGLAACADLHTDVPAASSPPAGAQPGAALAECAFRGLLAAEPAVEVGSIAAKAVADGDLLDGEGPDGPSFQNALGVLVWAGCFDDADPAIDEAMHRAASSGSPAQTASVLYRRGMMRFFQGRLTDAIGDAIGALAARTQGWHLYEDSTNALLALALMEHGELEAAARVAASEGAGNTPMHAWLLEARGRVAAAKGDTDAAITHLRACGALLAGELEIVNPALSAWRGALAEVLQRAGRDREALVLAREEVELAERFGAGRPLAAALRASARVGRPKDALTALTRAAGVVEGTGARLEEAKVNADLGTALVRAGQRTAAVDRLQRALELAEACAAAPLVTRVGSELRHAGAKPARGGRGAVVGPDALTPSERRVVELAVRGMTNREIAGELYVSVKAVEYHLGNAYGKLGISSRRELAPALG